MNVSTFAVSVAAALLAASIAVLIYTLALWPAQGLPPRPQAASPTATAQPTAATTPAATTIATATTPAQAGLRIINVTLYVVGGDLPGMGGWWNYTYLIWVNASGSLRPEDLLADLRLADGRRVAELGGQARVLGGGGPAAVVAVQLRTATPLRGFDLTYGGTRYRPARALNASYVGTVEVMVDGRLLLTRTVNGPVFPDAVLRLNFTLPQGRYRVSVSPPQVAARPDVVEGPSAVVELRVPESRFVGDVVLNLTRT